MAAARARPARRLARARVGGADHRGLGWPGPVRRASRRERLARRRSPSRSTPETTFGIASAASALGVIQLHAGDVAGARALLTEALDGFRRLRASGRVGWTLVHLASLDSRDAVDEGGDPDALARSRPLRGSAGDLPRHRASPRYRPRPARARLRRLQAARSAPGAGEHAGGPGPDWEQALAGVQLPGGHRRHRRAHSASRRRPPGSTARPTRSANGSACRSNRRSGPSTSATRRWPGGHSARRPSPRPGPRAAPWSRSRRSPRRWPSPFSPAAAVSRRSRSPPARSRCCACSPRASATARSPSPLHRRAHGQHPRRPALRQARRPQPRRRRLRRRCRRVLRSLIHVEKSQIAGSTYPGAPLNSVPLLRPYPSLDGQTHPPHRHRVRAANAPQRRGRK